MGKDRSHKHTLSFAKNSRSVWNGILEIVEFHRWPRVKKVFPNKRHVIERHESGDGIKASGSDPFRTSEIQDFSSGEARRIFETDDVYSISPARRSESTQMKALIAQEMVEDNSRRRRSTTYPLRSQLKRTLSFHHIQPKTSFDVTYDGVNGSQNGKNGGNYPPQIENDTEISKNSEDLPKENPRPSIADPPLSLPMMPTNLVDAAKVVSMKNDTFLKILEDRSYPLFYQLHDGGMVELTKCESFRHPVSSRRHDRSKSELDTPEDIDSTVQKSRISDHEKNEKQMAETGSNELGITHFTEMNGKERRRISLDAVFHRIPHGGQFSTESLGRDRMKDGTFSSPRMGKHNMKRTSSLIESLDRFSQLFPNAKAEQEDLLGHETKKSLSRIYSSPDLPTPLCSTDDPSDSSVLRLSENSEIDRTGINKDKIDVSEFESGSNSLLDGVYENRENMDESLSIVSTEAKASVNESSMFSNEDVLDPYLYEDGVDATIESTSKDENEESISKRLLLQDLNSLKSKTSTIDTLRILEEVEQEESVGNSIIIDKDAAAEHEKEEDSVGTSTMDTDAEYEQEFNYIRELLQASGFIGSDSVGSWHSPDQPLDPFLFDKMETYFATESGEEEEERRKSRVRMLLFDMINEMLVDHYDRSFTYFPVPSSPLLPVLHRILEKLWGNVRWLLSFRPETDPTFDTVTSRDVVKDEGWMHLQFDVECVSLQVEDLILDHLIDEVFST